MRTRASAIAATVTVLAAAVLAAAPAEAAAKAPSALRVVGTAHLTSIVLRWAWMPRVSGYQLQVATDPAFGTVVETMRVTNPKRRPAVGAVSRTVTGLHDATAYVVRIRAVRAGRKPSLWSAPVAAATAIGRPSEPTGLTARAGPKAGELTFTWRSRGSATTAFRLQTATTPFSPSNPSLPLVGRDHVTVTVPARARTITLSADQVAAAGAPAGSGIALLYRFYAVNHGTAGERVRAYPRLHAVLPQLVPAPVNAPGPQPFSLRVASYNVRSARITTDTRRWPARRAGVVETVLAAHPEVVALQELSPGRADGLPGSTAGTLRQTTSLLAALAEQDANRYRLVRTTPYVRAGTPHGTQGTRILYDATRLKLVSPCAETTGTRAYSSSCSVELPLLSGDPETARRSATFVEFADVRSGRHFFFASAHLDNRHAHSGASDGTGSGTGGSTTGLDEQVYGDLRARQIEALLTAIARVNTAKLPVILGGDLNSWQNLPSGDAPHDALIRAGFIDAASAPSAINLAYSTLNGFRPSVTPSALGFGSRLDGVYVSGRSTATTFENVVEPDDAERPSDHNLVVADLLVG